VSLTKAAKIPAVFTKHTRAVDHAQKSGKIWFFVGEFTLLIELTFDRSSGKGMEKPPPE
jgi:hypothetical protein